MVALPPVTLTCRADHRFTSRARGGQPVKCPQCKVSVWVPTGRPTGAPVASSAPTMAQRWANQEPADEMEQCASSAHPCPECGGARLWEPGRTLLICLECRRLSLPPSIPERYQRAELATVKRSDVDRKAELKKAAAVRMEQAQRRDKLIRALQKCADFVDPDEIPEQSYLMNTAVDLHSNLTYVIRELRIAKTADEVEAVEEIAGDLVQRFREMHSQFEGERNSLQRQQEQEQQYLRYQNDDDDEDYEDEPEPSRVITQYARPVAKFAPGPARVPVRPAAPTLVDVVQQVQRKISEIPWCAFDHVFRKRATLSYAGAQQPGGVPPAGAPYVLCCEAHEGAAEAYLDSQGWPNSTYATLGK